MATKTFRGKAQLSGASATFDVILYPVQQSMKMTHEFQEEVIMDDQGQDASWRGQNEKVNGQIEMKLLGDTFAHASSGAAFLAPYAIVTVSQNGTLPIPPAWIGTWQIVPGADISTKNDGVGDISYKLRRYVDSTQQTLAATAPS